MAQFVVGACIVLVLFVFFALSERHRMRHYWNRVCTGRLWRRRFPDASKSELRAFLDLFTAAFGFTDRRRLCFAPDDRLMDIYRALNPDLGMPDALELETFAIGLKERYGLDITCSWNENITLGELFRQVSESGKPRSV